MASAETAKGIEQPVMLTMPFDAFPDKTAAADNVNPGRYSNMLSPTSNLISAMKSIVTDVDWLAAALESHDTFAFRRDPTLCQYSNDVASTGPHVAVVSMEMFAC